MNFKLIGGSVFCVGVTLACSPVAPSISKKDAAHLTQGQSFKQGLSSGGDATFKELEIKVVTDKNTDLSRQKTTAVSQEQLEALKDTGSAEIKLGALPPKKIFFVCSMSSTEVASSEIQSVKFTLSRKSSGSSTWVLTSTPATRLDHFDDLMQVMNSLESIEIVPTDGL